MSVKDIIKSSILSDFQNVDITAKTATIYLLVACIMGIYIFIVYRLLSTNRFYSKTFNVSLVLMCILTGGIIITIQSSIVVSLGMVGALSIVRFRTAVKEPMDLAFLYWSISIGIISGAGMIGLGVIVSAIVTIVIVLFYYLPEKRQSLLLMVNASSNEDVQEIFEIVKKYDKKFHTHSRNINGDGADVLMEIHIKDGDALLKEVSALKGVLSVSLITQKGDSVY